MRYLIPLLALSACTDAQLSGYEASHAAWVCRNTTTVTALANAAIKAAPSIKDEKVRAAVVAQAEGDLGIVSVCGK